MYMSSTSGSSGPLDLKTYLKTGSSYGLISNMLLDGGMSHLEFYKRFRFPPGSLVAEQIFKTGMHGVLFTKVAQTAGISSLFGMGYYLADMKKNGLTRNNIFMLGGHSLFLAESSTLYYALAKANNIKMFHLLNTRAARFGGFADAIKSINYLFEKDYKSSMMYASLSLGNFSVMLFNNHHKSPTQSFLSRGFTYMPPRNFFLIGAFLYLYKAYTEK